MNLDDWLNKNPKKAKGFHQRIGVEPMTLWRYRNGKRKRLPERIMANIVRETAGAVTANDFYDMAQQASGKKHAPGIESREKGEKSKRHPLIGWMKGTFTIAPGVDLTEPAMPEWGEVAYGNKTWNDFK